MLQWGFEEVYQPRSGGDKKGQTLLKTYSIQSFLKTPTWFEFPKKNSD